MTEFERFAESWEARKGRYPSFEKFVVEWLKDRGYDLKKLEWLDCSTCVNEAKDEPCKECTVDLDPIPSHYKAKE